VTADEREREIRALTDRWRVSAGVDRRKYEARIEPLVKALKRIENRKGLLRAIDMSGIAREALAAYRKGLAA
jgi:hypothetical protein